MGAASLRTELQTGVATVYRELHQELASVLLGRCRELVEEYIALAKSAPAEFPFGETDLLRWYCEMKVRINGARPDCHGEIGPAQRKRNSRKRIA